MADILKRPMFRKGGSASEGVGITSGLTSRQNYEVGGGAVLPVIEEQYQEMRPKRSENIGNFIMALGATAPEDPTKLQTFGQVLSKAGTAASAMRQAKEAEATKFKTGATQKVIESMTQGEKDQLIRRAKMWAQTQRAAGKDMTDDQAIAIWLNAAISQGSPYLKGPSSQSRVLEMEKDYSNSEGEFGFSPAGARKVSEVIVAYQDKTLPDEILQSFKGPIEEEGSLIVGEDGMAELSEKAMKSFKSTYYGVNRTFVNPDDGAIYEHIGEGKFKRVYP
jgi:hypothetical protein